MRCSSDRTALLCRGISIGAGRFSAISPCDIRQLGFSLQAVRISRRCCMGISCSNVGIRAVIRLAIGGCRSGKSGAVPACRECEYQIPSEIYSGIIRGGME